MKWIRLDMTISLKSKLSDGTVPSIHCHSKVTIGHQSQGRNAAASNGMFSVCSDVIPDHEKNC